MANRINNRQAPFENFWTISEDAWLGFLGNLVSAVIAAAVAAWILRRQIEAQVRQRQEDLDRERRSKENEIFRQISPLLPHFLLVDSLDEHNPDEDKVREFDRLVDEWRQVWGFRDEGMGNIGASLHSAIRCLNECFELNEADTAFYIAHAKSREEISLWHVHYPNYIEKDSRERKAISREQADRISDATRALDRELSRIRNSH